MVFSGVVGSQQKILQNYLGSVSDTGLRGYIQEFLTKCFRCDIAPDNEDIRVYYLPFYYVGREKGDKKVIPMLLIEVISRSHCRELVP